MIHKKAEDELDSNDDYEDLKDDKYGEKEVRLNELDIKYEENSN